MPRYLRVSDVPAMLEELQGLERGAPYQKNEWQRRWCHITDAHEENAAVMSYRWRIRGRNENIEDYKRWLSDCGSEGYAVHDLRNGQVPVDWSLANGHEIQIEVAAWLLWLHTNNIAEYAWVDQMCVPQDADLEEKMGHIKDSPAIYAAGKVFVIIAPVVDYITGRIMNSQEARSIVKQYNSEMDQYRGSRFLSRSAVKALLVNNSYMRRVWTIQEAVAAKDLSVWPLKGQGEVNSYQSIYVVDWPEFNAWNSHPELPPLYLKFGDEPLNDYYEGDYTGVIKTLREHPSDAIAYLAMISKDVMWITMDRNSLINDLKKADTPARRAWVVLNNHQVQSARAFLPEDKVLALIPLVDYPAWKEATAGVPGRYMVQASVAWAYGLMDAHMATWKWSIRVYNSPTCKARGLELLQPRRNLGNSTSMHGATPNWQTQIPTEGGTFVLEPPPAHPDAEVTEYLTAAPSGTSGGGLELRVAAALLMPHPGQAKYWGGGPWTSIRDVLQTDEVFRLSVQWGLEPWRNPELNLDAERSAVVVVTGAGLDHPAMIILALRAGEEQPTTAEVMEVVDVSDHLLGPLVEGLRRVSLGALSDPLTAISLGVLPPPPTEPSNLGPAWQLVTAPEEEVPAAPASADVTMEDGAVTGAAPAAAAASSSPSSRPQSSRPLSARKDATAASSSPGSRVPSARPGSTSLGARPASGAVQAPVERPPSARPPSARPPSARPPSARPDSAAADAAAAPAAAASGVPSEAGAGETPSPVEVTPQVEPQVGEEEEEAPAPGPAIQKGGEVSGLAGAGVEVAAGAKYAGQAPVVQGAEGPCKGCIIS